MLSLTINIYDEPPTEGAISNARSSRDNKAINIGIVLPLGLDMAAAAVYGAHRVISGDPLEYMASETWKEWPEYTSVREYVRKVRAQGRNLIRAEVKELEAACAKYKRDREMASRAIDIAKGFLE